MAASILGTSENSLGGSSATTVVAPSRTYTTGSSLDIYTFLDNASTQAIAFTDSANAVAGKIGGVTPALKGAEVAIGADRYRHYVAENITGFTGTVTASFAASTFPSIILVEVGGVLSPSFDAGNLVSQAAPGTGADALTISATAAGAGGIIIGFTVDDSAANRIPAAGTGFVDGGTFWLFGGAQKTARLESKAYTGIGVKSATWTVASGGGPDTYANFISLFIDTATPSAVVAKKLRTGPFRFFRRETRSYTNPVTTQIVNASGSSTLAFSQAAQLTARVSAAGSSSLSFAQQAALTARVSATGSSSLSFTTVAQAVAYAVAQAVSALSFSSIARLLGYANASASSSLAFNASATVGAYADFRGTSSFNFGLSGTSGSSSNISGSAILSFAVSGTLSGRASMHGSAALSFSQTAFLTAFANVRVTASIAFDVTGTLTNKSSSSGAVSFTFAVSARLSAFGDMRAASTLLFAAAAHISSPASIAGGTSLSFTAAGRGASVVNAHGTSSLVFATAASMKAFANMGATAPFTFAVTAQAHTYVELNGSTSISFTCEIDTGLLFPPGAAMFDISLDQREFSVQFVERTLGVN